MPVLVGRETTPPRTAFVSDLSDNAGQAPRARGSAIHARYDDIHIHSSVRVSYDFAREPGRIAELPKTAVSADEKKFASEQRLHRVTVQEVSLPLESLTSARDVAQVFADVVQGHARLYDCTKILHGDISMSNIMYRVTEDGRVYGVLNDFDLSSILSVDDVTSTCLQRIGTPPFMAIDLLVDANRSAPKHLYRHDLESFFYVMVVFTSQYTLHSNPHVERELKRLPFEDWFHSMDFGKVRRSKKEFIFDEANETLNSTTPMTAYMSPSFHDLAPWLRDIRFMFRLGLRARRVYRLDRDIWQSWVRKMKAKPPQARRAARPATIPPAPPAPFDNETLDGKVSYNLFMADVGEMTFGDPIVIKYESTVE